MSTATAEQPVAERPGPTTTNKSTVIATRVTDEAMARIEAISQECGLLALDGQSHFQRTFKLAAGIRALRNAITKEMMSDLMDLQGTKLGFKTDKDREPDKNGHYGYPEDVVKECAIECVLRGGMWVGNEFNIIAGGCYLTKEFFQRIMREMKGLTDVVLTPGVPMMAQDQKTAYVPYTATWKYFGTPGRMEKIAKKSDDGTKLLEDTRIAVRVNSGMGPDAILGKAERKMRAAIYSLLTGSTISDGDADDQPLRTIVVESSGSKASGLAERLTVDKPTNAAAREPGDDPPEPEHVRLSDLALAIEGALHEPALTLDENRSQKQYVIEALAAGKLTTQEATHLQRIVSENAERLKQKGKS